MKFYIQVHTTDRSGSYCPIQFAAICRDQAQAVEIADRVSAAHGDAHWDVEKASD